MKYSTLLLINTYSFFWTGIAQSTISQDRIKIKSPKGMFDTLVKTTGVSKTDPAIVKAYKHYAGSLTDLEKEKVLEINPGQIAALMNLTQVFCEQTTKSQKLRTKTFGKSVDFTKKPADLSKEERYALVSPWVKGLWNLKKNSDISLAESKSLISSVDQLIADNAKSKKPADTYQIANASCVMVAISLRSLEK